jgi:hypothetical protein
MLVEMWLKYIHNTSKLNASEGKGATTVAQRPRRPNSNRASGSKPAATPPIQPAQSPELPGILGRLARNNKLLGWLDLVAAILLFIFTVQGFANGQVFYPFGFGLMGLYFFYGYVRNGLKVNFGNLTVPLNLVLLIGALVCLVLGIQNEAK